MFTVKTRRILGGTILTAALAAVPIGIEQVQAAQMPDGVMGQSLADETVYDEQDLDSVMYRIMGRSAAPLRGAAEYTEDFLSAAWTTEGEYTDAIYYHKPDYEDFTLLNGIDVSWWQGGGKGSSSTSIDWAAVHDAGISYAFVRTASRDTADGSIYEDTCADAHIQGALENNINVGVYMFSQALNEEEAVEEAEFVLEQIDSYGWDLSLPIVLDREPGANKRLTAGMLSKEEETDICVAFAQAVKEAGYQPMVYTSYNWIKSYVDTDRLEDEGCLLWLARYNNTTTSNSRSGEPFADVPYDYEFWQYSSTAKIDGYSGNLDVDFWYKDTSAKTNSLTMQANDAGSITLNWSRAGDAHMYRLYRYDEEQEKYVAVKSTSGTSYTDTGLAAGETYQYRVRGYWTIGGTNYYGKYSDVLETTTLPASVDSITVEGQTATTITLGWNEVHGATGYRIYQYDEESGSFLKLTDVGPDVTSFKIAGLSGAKEYQYKVRAIRKLNGTSYLGASSAAFAAVTKPAKVSGLTVETATSTSVNLSWNKVVRATGYQIYRLNKKTGKYERIKSIKGNKIFDYTDTGLSGGTEYTYKVRAYLSYGESNYYGTCSTVVSGITKPAKVKGLSLTTKSSAITLKWTKQSSATGYQIYRLNSKTGKYEKIATLKGASGVTYKDTKLKKGTTYTYKVRAYKSYGGTNYFGSFSSAMSLKAK